MNKDKRLNLLLKRIKLLYEDLDYIDVKEYDQEYDREIEIIAEKCQEGLRLED